MASLIVDYAWGHPSLQAVAQVGYVGIARYLSPDPTKNLTATEAAAARALNLSIVVVWESTAGRALEGRAAGAADAAAAAAQANALGFPGDRPIYYAVDTDTTWAAVSDYFAGVASAGPRPVGAYGGIKVVDPGLQSRAIAYGWQTCAWSGQSVSQLAHLYQRLRPTLPSPGGSVDEDVCLKADYGQWGAAAPSPGPLPPPDSPQPAGPIPAFPGYIQQGSHGAAVFAFQSRLAARGWKIAVDGVDGPATTAVLVSFQREKGLAEDGIGGPLTWDALWAAPITP